MRHFFILTVVICITGCHSHISPKIETIHITKNIVEAISIDDIFSEYEFVSLEATDSSLLGFLSKIVLKNNIFFVSDGRRIIQFSIHGDYLRTLDMRGRGPQEYLGITDFVISEEAIIIWDQNDKTVLRYSLDNKFIDKQKLEDFIATIHMIGKDKLLFSSAYPRGADYKFMIRDVETMELLANFCPIDESQITYRHFMGQQNYYEYKNTLLFHEPMNNYIYKIENFECMPIYYMDIYGQNPPDEFWSKEYQDIREVREKAQQNRYCFGVSVYAESDKQIFFCFDVENKSRRCIYAKETGESVQFDKFSLHPSIPPVGIMGIYAYSDDYFLLELESDVFYDDNGDPYVAELSHLKHSGNPVICIAKLK